MAGVRVTSDDICEQLVSLGIGPGDVIFVHSSLTAFGHVEGGPEAVVDAAHAAVGPTGTVLMPTYVPTGDWIAYAKGDPLYDPATSPSSVGVITEVFRQQSGVVRSQHPTHAVAGVGPNAESLLRFHHTSPTPCGPGSPLWKIAHDGGKIVHLGSPFGSMTIVHVVEDSMPDFPIDPYLPTDFPLRVVEADGSISTINVRMHDPRLLPARIDHLQSKSDDIYARALARGIVQTGTVGNATVHVLDGPGVHAMLTDLAALGITIYDLERLE